MQQLVLQFPAIGVEDFDALVDLEGRLIDALGDSADVDGHDFGSGEMNIFIWTDDAPATFAEARQVVAGHPLAHQYAAGWRGEDDADYTPLWPRERTQFKVI